MRMQVDATGKFDSKHRISDDLYYAALLHDHPELLDDCCELINAEWKRSHIARLRSISGSSSNFPTSVLLLRESKPPQLIGHCKLSKISHSSPVIFLDTLVIHPKFRGKGLGRLLMQKAEDYVKSKGIQCLYLSTMGQELFYEKLGYSYCQPINIYGGQMNYTFSGTENEKPFGTTLPSIVEPAMAVLPPPPPPPAMPIPPPPPPPPLPPLMGSFSPNLVQMANKKNYMRKNII